MEAERKERGGGAIIPDAAQADELDELIRRVPKVIALLPDVLHRGRNVDDRHVAAVEEMTQRLLAVVGKARPSTLVRFLI
jgi:nuclear pore complex protein Nup98-Nup96